MVPKEVKLEFYHSYEYILHWQIEIMHETDNKEIFKDEYLSMYHPFGDIGDELNCEELLDIIGDIDDAVNKKEDRGSATLESTQNSFESTLNPSLCSLPDFSTGQACLPSHSSLQASLPGSFDQEGLDNGGLESSESNNNNQEDSSLLQNYPIQQASIRYIRRVGEPVDRELFTQNYDLLTDAEGNSLLRISDSLRDRQGSGSLIDDYADLSIEYMESMDPDL